MNNQDYLDQISASARPVSTSNKLFSTRMLIFLIGAAVLLIAIIICGIILGSSGNKSSDLAKQLSIRLTNVSKTIDTYNPSVKSSSLRQHGSQTNAVIKNTLASLNPLLEKEYGYKKPDEKSKVYLDEKEFIDGVNKNLEHARLNAYLDRVYVSELIRQIELILAMDSEIYKKSDDEELKKIVETTSKSLNVILPGLQQDIEKVKNI